MFDALEDVLRGAGAAAMIRLALPTGDLRRRDGGAARCAAASASRTMRAGSRELRFPFLPDGSGVARVFREKDIPVQVALGNYDVGICSLDMGRGTGAALSRATTSCGCAISGSASVVSGWRPRADARRSGDRCGSSASTRISPRRSRGACGCGATGCSASRAPPRRIRRKMPTSRCSPRTMPQRSRRTACARSRRCCAARPG